MPSARRPASRRCATSCRGVDVGDIRTSTPQDARLGVELRNGLLFNFTGGSSAAPPTHKLVVRMTTTRTSAIVDLTTARPDIENYGIDVTYELREIATDKRVLAATHLRAGVLRHPGPGAALRPHPRTARRREPRHETDRREHQPAAGLVLRRRHLRPDCASWSRSTIAKSNPIFAKPSPAHAIILIYGADVGLVRERADALIAAAVDDINDPFSLVRLEGDDLAGEPSRLVDEAMTVPLFGGRRAIRVRAGGRNFSSGVEILLQEPPKDCRIVIEAGELRRNSPLRVMCEKAKTAGVVACYADTARDLAKLIDDELRTANLRIDPDARAALSELLGGDRLASRNEIRKLALYAHGKDEITLDDIAAVVTDASSFALDPIVDSAFAGKPAELETNFAKAMAAGTNPNAIMFAASRQASQLHRRAA